jgi:hypothetical protein
MNPENSKPMMKEETKGKGRFSGSKRRMLKVAQEWKPNVSPQLREAYSAKTEWARKVIPKMKKGRYFRSSEKSLDNYAGEFHDLSG